MSKCIKLQSCEISKNIIDIVPIRLDAIPFEADLPPSLNKLCLGLKDMYPFSEEALTNFLIEFNLDENEVFSTAQFNQDKYVRIRLYDNENFEVLILCWLKGQTTRIHDHAGSLCAVKILQGIGKETLYTPKGNGRKVKALKNTLISKGSVTVSSDSDIHSLGVSNNSADSLVTLHIYSPPLKLTMPYKAVE